MKRLSRADDGFFSRWWWSVDRYSLAILGMIILIGFVVLLAAGPAAAGRIGGIGRFHFSVRQAVFLLPALILVFSVSLLSPLYARRLGACVFLAGIILMAAMPFFALEINGSRRWIDIGPVLLQPSEFAKPGFVVTVAWMLAEQVRDPRFRGGLYACIFYGIFSVLLLLQPDFGQWVLMTAVFSMMLFIAGRSWKWMTVTGISGVCTLVAAYYLSDHVAARIDGFLSPDAADTYQVDRSLEAIANGGIFGRGEGMSVKEHLPDAHADFIFAVAGEEFGFVLCLVMIALYAFFVIRAFLMASGLRSILAQCAVCGLAATIGFQVFINIGVALRALPAKGMTLPFVSYGGSSLLATALCTGLILSFMRGGRGMLKKRKDIMP